MRNILAIACILFACCCQGSELGTSSSSLVADQLSIPGGTYTHPHSLVFWINSGAAPSSSNVGQPFVITGTYGGTGLLFSWNHNNGSFIQACASQDSGGGFHGAKISSSLSANTWYHIACTETKSGSNCTLHVYLNGSLDTSSGSYTCSTGLVNFGSNGGPFLNFVLYSGSAVVKIKDGAYWYSNLSDAEVLSIYRGTSPCAIRPAFLLLCAPLHGLTNELNLAGLKTNGMGKSGSPTAVTGVQSGPWPGAQW